MPSLSAFELYSVGVVSCVKQLGDGMIEASPRELRVAHQELVHSNPQREEKTVKTNAGERVINSSTDNSIPCQWLAYNSMRKTPPDVRHGDEVLIYKLGDEKYFWVELNSMDMKRLETVVYAISADPSNPMKPDYSNAYFFTFSSHEKKIHIRLNKVTDELTGFDILLDGKNGYASLNDDLENAIFVNSKDTVVGSQNADGTLVVLNKEDITMYAPNMIDMEAENFIMLKAKAIRANCEDWEVNASNSYRVNTPNAEYSNLITTPEASINGIKHSKHVHTEQGDGKDVSGPK